MFAYACVLILSVLFVLTFLTYFFFFNDTPTTDIYTLSLHDALPIYFWERGVVPWEIDNFWRRRLTNSVTRRDRACLSARSEEHTSELQSLTNLVCRLLLEKKKKKTVENKREDDIGKHRHCRRE